MRRALWVLVFVLQLGVSAQTVSLRGRVVDATNALIPGVAITVQNLETGLVLTAVTDDRGEFLFAGLTPGRARVQASLPGFQIAVINLEVTSSTPPLSIALSVASVSTSVEIVAALPATTTQVSASIGAIVRPQRAVRRVVLDRGPRAMNTEAYDHIHDNPFKRVTSEPRTTFALEVDTASYANVRRFINSGQLPPKDAVRIEELINYFRYTNEPPQGADPIAIYTEVAAAPWNPEHRLVRVGIRARDVDISSRKAANLVFLIDVSGSMGTPEKLPLVARSLHLLVDQLRNDDSVAIVVYAGSSGMVLRPTTGSNKELIQAAIDRLAAGGSTNGGEGIQLAYRLAAENFIPNGINRVILATDGDFNVGITNEGDLIRLIEKKSKSGVFLTVLGYGVGNYKDSTLEKLADKGHGNYAYIDTFQEARRVLVEQLSGTLLTVAKDVKLQVEFNPSEVEAYRLIGYENRLLEDEDFDDDNKQGGDVGSGHNITALFDVVPHGVDVPGIEARSLKYQKERKPDGKHKGELLTVSVRYKLPESAKSVLLEVTAKDAQMDFTRASTDLRFASAVAAFGMILRDSPYKGQSGIDQVIQVAAAAAGGEQARLEFVELARGMSVLIARD